MTDETERKEAEIVRRIHGPGYSHAENIYVRLRELTQRLPYAEVVDTLHAEVVGDG